MIDLYDLNIAVAILAGLKIGGILLFIDAVMRPLSSQDTLAWSGSWISLSIVAIQLYLILGRTQFEGYSEAL